MDARHPELRDRLEELPRLADAEGHDRRAARFDDHVVGDAAGPELVVQAVDDAEPGPRAGAEHRPPAEPGDHVHVALREGDDQRATRRARGAVDAHDAVRRARDVVAERRRRLLGEPDLLLVGERQRLEAVQRHVPGDGRAELPPVEVRACGHVPPLRAPEPRLQRRQRFGRHALDLGMEKGGRGHCSPRS